PQAAPGLPVRGEEAGGVEISGRPLQAARHHFGRRGLPSAQGRQLPAGKRVTWSRFPKRTPTMEEVMKRLLGLAALSAALACGSAYAQQVTVKIGVLSDMSSLYADIGGPGSVAAAKMAIADFAKAHPDVKVDLVSADHQNKPDVGSSIANQWFDTDKVDMIIDVPNSGVALAVSQVANQKNKVFIVSGAAASDLTGPKCNANTVHWTYDTWMLANGTGKAIVKTGGDTWFFLTADYAFGHALERDTGAAVVANGGKVLGQVRHPLNTSDF